MITAGVQETGQIRSPMVTHSWAEEPMNLPKPSLEKQISKVSKVSYHDTSSGDEDKMQNAGHAWFVLQHD
jgi:hypothetical protein